MRHLLVTTALLGMLTIAPAFAANTPAVKPAPVQAMPVPVVPADENEAAQEAATRAMELMSDGHPEEAIAGFDEALRLGFNDPYQTAGVQAMRSMVRLSMGDKTGAWVDADAAITAAPNMPFGYDARGMVHLQNKDYDKAIADFSTALSLEPDDPIARRMRLGAYVESGDFDRALVEGQLAVAAAADDAEARQTLARIYTAMSKYDLASEAYRKAVELDPEDSGLAADFAQSLVLCDAPAVQCQAQRTEALAIYDRLIAEKPTAYLYVARSQAHAATDFDGKRADIEAGLKLEPNSMFAIAARGSLSLSEQNYDEAIADATTVIAAEPDWPESYEVRGHAYAYQGKAELALKDWDSVKTLQPMNPNPYNQTCWLRATRNLQLDQALLDCHEATRLAPDAAGFIDSLAFTEFRLGRFDAALKDFDRALTINPKLAASLFMRGVVKHRMGDVSGGDADIAAARVIYDAVDADYAKYGVMP